MVNNLGESRGEDASEGVKVAGHEKNSGQDTFDGAFPALHDLAEEVIEDVLGRPGTSAPHLQCSTSQTDRLLSSVPLAKTTRLCGPALAWIVVQEWNAGPPSYLYRIFFEVGSHFPAPRRALLPLRLGELKGLIDFLKGSPVAAVLDPDLSTGFLEDCWLLLCVIGVNAIHGAASMPAVGKWRASDLLAINSMRKGVKAFLTNSKDSEVESTIAELRKELAVKRVNYVGEETLHCFPLTPEQMKPALPPAEHGGCVIALDWVSGLTRDFLLHPEKAVQPDVGQKLPKLQGKIHVAPQYLDDVIGELISRNVCDWVPLSSVLHYRGQPVLNGLFGVEKPTSLPSGLPILRTIMNLVPSNSVLKQLKGGTRSLPFIGQWLSTVIEDSTEVRLWQSDMSAAFYLFSLPPAWWGCLAFNIIRPAHKIGRPGSGLFAMCCKVIPMGFNSSVALMQEISENLLSKLPKAARISRGLPLPPWLTQTIGIAKDEQRAWYHVYLDNFCSAAKVMPPETGGQGEALHLLAEQSWTTAGVLSSAKKRKSEVSSAAELGALINGEIRTLGVTGERILKLIHLTIYVISQEKLDKKNVQVIAGRWVHVFQFRRAGMSCLNVTWQFVGGKKIGPQGPATVRRELWRCILLAPLLYTALDAKVSNWITASDASQKGGAVGIAHALTTEGTEFVKAMHESQKSVNTIPVLVVSLFNGIGGAARAYDLLGLQPEGLIFCDINPEANRIAMRRWPHAELVLDVRHITDEMIDSWALQYTTIEEVHLWAGFPCSDLSAAKAFRLNLKGEKSGLFSEVLRIRRSLRKRFCPVVQVKFALENVASMDREAAEEISRLTGVVPYFVDCADCVPIHRPRLCWTSETWEGIFTDIYFEEKRCWVEAHCLVEYPQLEDWITPGWEWTGYHDHVILPTAMRSVPKDHPPPFPAGYGQCGADTLQRWQADAYRFPPYQYKAKYIFTKGNKWRRVDASEKDLLLGYGWGHTELCMSASKIKQSYTKYEDCRQALLGDAFAMGSFALAAAGLSQRFMVIGEYSHVIRRLGMAPGFCAAPHVETPIQRRLNYGPSKEPLPRDPHLLNRILLSRTNHSGSDVRISTGQLLNPRAYPRQPVNSSWWTWRPVFSVKWSSPDHINLLELRSIVLSVRHCVSHLHSADMRLFHVSDSYVCLSVVSKGRSSSARLNKLLQQLNAILLASNIYLIVAHVESSDNPTDGASRKG